MSALTIGRVANRSGIGVETIRYYERLGLLQSPPRSASGYRRYDEDAVNRLRFIRQAKNLGFTLGEIKEILELHADPNSHCGDVKRRAEVKIREIDERIYSLYQMRGALHQITMPCAGDGPLRECPILSAIQNEEVPS